MAKKTAGSILRAICELGFRQAFWYGIHKAGIYSGLTRKQLPMGGFSNGMDNFPVMGGSIFLLLRSLLMCWEIIRMH
jgi:hypothetical protein